MKQHTENHAQETRRDALLIKIERLTELPLLLLSFVMIPLIIGPLLWNLSTIEENIFTTLDAFIWAIFAADLVIKTLVSTNKVRYLKIHWLEVTIVILPFFRPLRLLRLLIFGSRAFVGARRLANVDFILVYGLGLVIVAATLVRTVEHSAPNALITDFQEALWWSVVTVTTVGYGDFAPVTAMGRAIGVVLMIGGIALFSGITANLASFFVAPNIKRSSSQDELVLEIRGLRKQIDKLEAKSQTLK